MVIGIVNNLYYPYLRGSGVEVIAAKMEKELRAAGHEVFVITTKPARAEQTDSRDCYYLASHYHNLKNWPASLKICWHAGQLFLPCHRTKLKKILKERQPDLIITHNLVGIGASLPRLLRQRGIRHEHVLHDIQLLHPSGLMYWGKEKIIETLPAKIYQTFTSRALRGAAKIISPSQWLLNLHRAHGFFINQESIVRPNFILNRQPAQPLHRPVNFVFTGQLEKHKGVAVLLTAWKLAALSDEQAQLIIAGGGSLSDWLKKQAVQQKNLTVAGYLNREEINKLLTVADVVVVPSLVYENSPTSLWEAAERGLRAIASNLGGTPELAPYLNLDLVPPGDAGALANAIKKIITDIK